MSSNEPSVPWRPPSSAGSNSTDASLAFSSPAYEFGNPDERRVSFRDPPSSFVHHAPRPYGSQSPPPDSMATPSLRSTGSYGRVRSGSSASRPQHTSSMTHSMSSWTHATAANQPTTTKRSSLLGALSFSFSGRRPTSKRPQRQPVMPDYNEYYGDVLEITAAPTEDELERERLRAAAAQAVGLAITKPPSPELRLQPLPPSPLPPFPATLAVLAPRATLSAQVSKRSATSGFLGRVSWKQRVVMLTVRDMHTFIGPNEVERLALSTNSVAFVVDDDPAMGGRKSVIKLGSDTEWWTIQMRDASQMHVWLKAIKAAVAVLRDVPQEEPYIAHPLHAAPTTPTAQTFPSFGRNSLSSSPASSTRMSQTRGTATPPTTTASLKALLSARRLSVGRRRSPSDPGNGIAESASTAASISGYTLNDSVGPETLGRRIYDPSPLPPSMSHLPPRTPSPIKFEAPVVHPLPAAHRHPVSLPPPPRPRRMLQSTNLDVPYSVVSDGVRQPIDLSDSLLNDSDKLRAASKSPPSPELILRDLPASVFHRSRISLTSASSVVESDRDFELEQTPAVKHPYGAPNGTTSKSNKRLSTSSALSAGSGASGSGSSRFVRTGYGSGGVPPQRPPPVGSLPPTPGSNHAPASPPPTGPLPTPPSFVASPSSSSPMGTSTSATTATSSIQNRRSVRVSLTPALGSLPPSLPPSGPLPPTPTTGFRNRNSVTFAANRELPHSRSSSIRDVSSIPSSRTTSSTTSSADGQLSGLNGHARTDSTSSAGTSSRKRVSLKLRFRNSVTPQHEPSTDPSSSFFMPITPSPGSRSNGESTPTRERGTSFMSPITPLNEPSYSTSYPPPIPSPLPSELFTILPGPNNALRSASIPLRSPSFFPPPDQPPVPENSSFHANELFSSVSVPNRVRAGSLSTLELDPPEPKSLSPPPPRRHKRASMSSAAHSTRASIGSLSGISRRSGESSTHLRGSVDSASAIPDLLLGRASAEASSSFGTNSRPDSASSDVLHSLASTGETTPPHAFIDEVPVKPRISMDGELLDGNIEEQNPHSDDDDSYIDAAIPLPLSTTPSYEDEQV